MELIMRSAKLAALGSMVLLGMLLSLPTFAGTQLWDFEEKHDDWEVANGDWAIKGGIYQLERGGKAEHSLVGEEKWDDYTVEAKIRMDEGNWGGLIFRAQSEMEYYVYYLNIPNNKSELWRHNKGAWDTRNAINSNIGAAGKLKIENEEWYDVKVVVEGDLFQLHINGELQGEQTDSTYKTGMIGVWGWETGVSFDDVMITGDNVIDTLSVDPNQKLATTWGRLKQAF